MQRHHDSAQHVADEQSDDCPDRIGAEHDRQGTVHDGGDLHVGAEPQGELVTRRAVALAIGDDVDGAPLDSQGGWDIWWSVMVSV